MRPLFIPSIDLHENKKENNKKQLKKKKSKRVSICDRL